jgi:hypothetical protein
MKLFSLFERHRLRPTFEYTASGLIWRIFFAEAGYIVGENRTEEPKTVSFFCIHKENGSVVWQDVHLEEQWWTGIETVHRDVVLLHEYAKPDMPEHKKIIALNVHDGTLLWRNDELHFLFVHQGKVYAARDLFEKRLFFELDCMTGQVLTEFNSDAATVNTIRSGKDANEEFKGIVFTTPLSDLTTDQRLVAFIQQHCNFDLVRGDVEVIERNGMVLFGHHQSVESDSNAQLMNLLENHFKIIDAATGELLFTDVVNRRVIAPVPDVFFVKDDMAYYVKEQKTLVGIRLE